MVVLNAVLIMCVLLLLLLCLENICCSKKASLRIIFIVLSLSFRSLIIFWLFWTFFWLCEVLVSYGTYLLGTKTLQTGGGMNQMIFPVEMCNRFWCSTFIKAFFFSECSSFANQGHVWVRKRVKVVWELPMSYPLSQWNQFWSMTDR